MKTFVGRAPNDDDFHREIYKKTTFFFSFIFIPLYLVELIHKTNKTKYINKNKEINAQSAKQTENQYETGIKEGRSTSKSTKLKLDLHERKKNQTKDKTFSHFILFPSWRSWFKNLHTKGNRKVLSSI